LGFVSSVCDSLGFIIKLSVLILAVNFSLIMPDLIAEVLSYLFTGKAINELFTGRKIASFFLGRSLKKRHPTFVIWTDGRSFPYKSNVSDKHLIYANLGHITLKKLIKNPNIIDIQWKKSTKDFLGCVKLMAPCHATFF
jgi:hypothetical protein